ncbi:MAG TPA: glycosyltransferase family 4 protein [Xanthobacteraceae bacterium]|nr:glycosyltransferase family 4 protein [Xanthobacteraceae bacterium]
MTPPSGPRVLMTTDAVGGVWSYSTALAAALTRRGCEVLLVTLGPAPRSDQLAPLKDISGLAVEVTDYALEWVDPEGADLARAREGLAHLARRFGPDLVHVNGFREATADWPAPVLVVAHSCVCSWWRACRGEAPTKPRWLAYATNVQLGLLAADMWIAPTAALRDEVRSLYAPVSRGRVIPNGIDAVFGSVPKEPFILSAGRLWDEAKNIRLLAAIARDLPWPVQVAGAARSDANSVDTGTAVEALGELPRPALHALMNRAGIYAAPALYEPFGLAVLEAAAAGCALVLSDIPSFRELWSGAAMFADPQDEGAFAETLRLICASPRLRRDLQRAALRRARRYQLGVMVDKYCEVYAALVGQSVAQPYATAPTAQMEGWA